MPFDELNMPFATEYIETRGVDGYYRKYRYVAIGETGIPFHLPVCRYWEACCRNRISSKQNLAEEKRYIDQPDPNHELFQQTLRTLGLDYAAIDYSYMKNGQPIIWEVNATPHWGDIAACSPSVQRAYQKVTWELLQLIYNTAGMDFPEDEQRPLAA